MLPIVSWTILLETLEVIHISEEARKQTNKQMKTDLMIFSHEHNGRIFPAKVMTSSGTGRDLALRRLHQPRLWTS
jgi:hypothetical protein